MRRSGRRASNGCAATLSSPPAAEATSANRERRAAAYGREAITRSWARRSLAAETIFMALVICCVLRTERMRLRISMRLGMRGLSGVSRFLLGDEAFLEFLEHRVNLRAQRVVKRFLFDDLVPKCAVRIVHVAVHLLFELADLLDRQIVQITLRSGEDDHDLLFDG